MNTIPRQILKNAVRCNNYLKNIGLNHLVRTLLPYFLASSIGFFAFRQFYPLSFILTNEVGFYTGDVAQQVSGFYAFRDTPWHFPVFWTDRLNYPEGVSIINTDSMPIVALLVKPFVRFLPPDFHYFRLWYLLVFLIQGVGGVYLIRQMGRKRLIDDILAASFAVITPCFILRSGHTTLMTQGILLFALGFYFKGIKYRKIQLKPPRHWYVIWIALFGISFLMHAYFTVMILPIYWAAILDIRRKQANWFLILLECLAPLVFLIILFMALWYSPNSVLTAKEGGYGQFSMNLLAPFVGGKLITWGENLQAVSPEQSYEGFNYLGLGVIILSLLAIIFQRKSIKEIVLNHRFLLLCFLLLTLFALSNKIYAGKTLLWEYPAQLSEWVGVLGTRFRSTGRFFWPVSYGITFTAIAAFLGLKQKFAPWIVAILLVVQWCDIPKLNFDGIMQTDSVAKEAFPPRLWDRILSGKEALYVTPAFKCGSRVEEVSTLQLLAAENHVLINTVYGARNTADCDTKQSEMLSHFDKDTVHVFLSVTYKNPISLEQVQQWVGSNIRNWCRIFPRGIICIPEPDENDLKILNHRYFSKIPKDN